MFGKNKKDVVAVSTLPLEEFGVFAWKKFDPVRQFAD